MKKEEYEVVIHNLFRSEPNLRAWAVPLPIGVRPAARYRCVPLPIGVRPAARYCRVPLPIGVRPAARYRRVPLPIGVRPAARYCRVPLPCRQASVLDHSKDPCKENFIPNTKVRMCWTDEVKILHT